MINSWEDVYRSVWLTPDGATFIPYSKDGWVYYFFTDTPERHTKWLQEREDAFYYFNGYRRGGDNPLSKEFTGPMQIPPSPILLKIRQMDQRRVKHARV